VPPGFQFALKAPNRVVADLAGGKGVSRAMGTFLESAVGLRAALGPVLIQIPGSRRADRHALAEFLEGLPQGLRVAFDFKHPSWREDATLRLLSAHDAALVITDEGDGTPPLTVTAGFTYVRIRGEGDDEHVIDAWAERLGALTRRGIDVYAFLKHDRRGVAVAAGVLDVVVDRVVVGRDRLERRGVGVGQGPTGRPEDVPDLEILERLRFDDHERRRIELVRAGGWLGHSRCSLRGNGMG